MDQKTDLFSNCTTLVESRGDQVRIHSAECVTFLLGHPTCKDCPTELGCAKASLLLAVTSRLAGRPMETFMDLVEIAILLGQSRDRILNARTVEELLKLGFI